VWISVQHHSGSVFLSVHDDGPGGAATDPQVTSRRLGLAVLADVIRDAGGRMHVTSTGTGTTLTVQVPA
jgi:C4-dicarboxylate-specific signal transduction histidine kinase